LTLACFIAGALSWSADQINVTGRVELSGPSQAKHPDFSGAVVWLENISTSAAARAVPSEPARQVVQKDKTFSPHMVVIPVGSAVEFPNRDPFFHNVFSLYQGSRFDLGLYEAGSTQTVVFNRPGISYIFCNIHPEMSAVVIALKTPYYGVSDRKGAVAINGVPAGTYQLQVWHERALPETVRSLTRNIVISETSSSFGVLNLPEQRNFIQAHKNKYGQDYQEPLPAVPTYTKP
jgi:plastocyanin